MTGLKDQVEKKMKGRENKSEWETAENKSHRAVNLKRSGGSQVPLSYS